MRTRQTRYSGNSYWSDIIYQVKEITATNLNAAESYTEDTSLDLNDIVINKRGQGIDDITITLTLSNPSAGSLNTATSGSVTSTYNGGTGIWSASGAIDDINTLLAALTFTPAVNFNSNFTIAVNISNDEVTLLTGTKEITGVAVNDAPVLDATKTPVLNSIAQDSPAPVGTVGSLISVLVDSVVPTGGLDNVTDIDADSIGVAIVGADTTSGTWYYSTDNGTIWNALGAVSDSSARLLSPTSRLYFYPNNGFSGTIDPAITFRAWDQTSGTNGQLVSVLVNGGTTAFSSATDTAGITVT